VTEPSLRALRALAEKYRTLARWRRDKRAGLGEPERAVYRAMAEAFPGALRELEVLTLEVLDARADALSDAAAGTAPIARWMRGVDAYHRWMRAALFIKAHGEWPMEELARGCLEHSGVLVDRAFVERVLDPPEGRMRPVVLDQVARLCEIDRAELEAFIVVKLR
jgi:hypothetical protein